ncbi:DUF7601 domain-containing protein [Coprococcus sp. LG100-32]|jgi:hypothetical protein|uniref:DUF7601 domain-containing protein n=1 Tax=Coprococcus sp. LG100-32 TaxID=2997994 RepID=UPI0022E83DD7|nr:DUF5979 domain-containing protein [Coprococcus sp. LG100-32]
MSMKKFTKKMLAIVAAGAMTMGMAMPAMAAEGTTADTVNNAKEAYISKTYNTEVGKAETFSFTATQITDGDDVIHTAHAVTIPTISFGTTDLGTTTKTAKINLVGTDFPEAGRYSYTVKENETADPSVTETAYEKLIMSKAEYRMDVYVVEKTGGTLEIDKIIVNKTKGDKDGETTGKVDIGSDAKKNGFNFVNTYVQEAGTGAPDPDKPVTPDPDYKKYGALNVSKKVIQNVTDDQKSLPTEKFDFTAKFEFPAGTDANTLGGVKDKDGNGVTLDATGQCTFQLGNGENMKFTGLPVGTTITVTEAAKANYKGSTVVTLNGVETSKAATKYNEAITASGKLGQKKNIVDVTNKFNNVPTTGIIMNTLPYVLMVALCAVALFGFVAFKRKKVQK